MVKIQNYLVQEELNTESGVKIYRGTSKENEPIIIKLISDIDDYNEDVINLKNEYDILRYLESSPKMIKVFSFEKTIEGHILVIEDIGGLSLKELIKKEKLSVKEFLNYGIQICDCLSEIHRKKVIHKDIKPSNIIVNKEKNTIRIIDFGISSRLHKEESRLTAPNVLEGSLQYLSPEQTGRMNRSVDYRTDFYSLGITFYELLTGRLPFESEDLLELVHFHLAKSPKPPHLLNPAVSTVISDIILKLMEKTAERRYQTALGIRADFQNCLEQLENTGTITTFPLAQRDIKDEYRIPQKLYGREKEIETLISSFDRMNETGIPSLMLIGGYSGVGKSALIKEINKPLTESRGYFVSGKYDQFNKNLPFSAIIQVFTNLIRLILTEEPHKVIGWQKELQVALGSNAGVISEVIPELEIILGKSEALPELGSQENANRFYLAFLNFIKVFAQKDHPLAIFLDDLQWADSASFSLIKNLMEDSSVRYLYIMIAFRENEITAGHPLLTLMEELKVASIKIESISLLPLSASHVKELLSDSLYKSKEELSDIANLIHSKTNGNPFFITELLRQLIHDKLIYFSFEKNEWKWDLKKIKDAEISENVVELLLNRIKLLPESVRNIMQLASCIGNEFELFTLSVISEIFPFTVAKQLKDAISEEMIIPIGDSYKRAEVLSEDSEEQTFKKARKIKYRFQHDRVQQAAYELIEINIKKQTRLNIGRTLLKFLKESEMEEKIFDIVNHLNEGSDFITSQEEKKQLIELNLKAGKKAKSATAYKPALEYLNHSKQLLDDHSWETNYAITFSVYRELAEVEYLNGNMEVSENTIQFILSKATSPLDRAEIYRLLIIQYTLVAKYEDAILALSKALIPLNIILPEENLDAEIGMEFEKINQNLKSRDILSLLNEKAMEEEIHKKAVVLLTTSMPACYLSNPKLWTILVLKATNLFLIYGNSPETYGYSCYGILLAAAFGKFKEGYEFAQVAFKISEKFKSKADVTKASNVLANLLMPWVMHIKHAEEINQIGYQSAMESGEFQHGTYCTLHIPTNSYFQGKNLGFIETEITSLLPFSKKAKNQMAIETKHAVYIIINNLMGKTNSITEFSDNEYDESQLLKSIDLNKSQLVLGIYEVMKAHVLFLYGEYEEAYNKIKEALKKSSFLTGEVAIAELNFYHSLVLCALYSNASKKVKKEYMEQLEKNQTQMKIWADSCRENFLHKYYLIEAELARLKNQKWKAAELYEKSIMEAFEHGFVQNEALAMELSGKFWIKNDNEKFAYNYLFAALKRFDKWGAVAKVEQLKEKYPRLLSDRRREPSSISNTKSKTVGATFIHSGESLDLQSVLKSSAAISSEIRLDSLLEKLIQILIENAGAQRGILLLKENRTLIVKAQSSIEETKVSINIPISDFKDVASSVIYYVERTKENLVLAEAISDEKFKQDKYIENNNIKSVLCAPIIKQGELTGILYLENNLTTNAFTPERLKVVNLLSSQAAISIENAILYEDMEQKVKERTAQLAEKNEELAEKNKHITDSIYYAKTIQSAILPSKTAISKKINDFLIFFRPKDIVSGDFFWFTTLGDYSFIAAVDCTGHGVPGALMSMLGKSILDQIVNEKKIIQPSEILSHLDYNVRIALKQDKEDSESRDGMDVSLCRISENELLFSGAKRPLYSVINGVIETHKGNKDSIGGKVKKDEMKKFTDITFSLSGEERRVFYLTTDGFGDQPNPERKKIGSRGLLELIGKIYLKDGLEQKEIFGTFLDDHQNGETQRDDITVIGIII